VVILFGWQQHTTPTIVTAPRLLAPSPPPLRPEQAEMIGVGWQWQRHLQQSSHLGHAQLSQILIYRGKKPAEL